MKVDRSTKDTHGSRLLAAGARLFRLHGIARVSIAEISAEAGLTHGAFYGHYASKASLAEAACHSAREQGVAVWRERAENARRAGQDPLDAIIDGYLTMAHCEDPGQGCVLAALAGDAGRATDGAIAAQLDDMAHMLVSILAETLGELRPTMSAEHSVEAGWGALAAMQGGLILARARRQGPGGAQAAEQTLLAARRAARRALD